MQKFILKLKDKNVLSLDWNEENYLFENIVFEKEFEFLKSNTAFDSLHFNGILFSENILPKQRLIKIENNEEPLSFYLNDYGLNLNNGFWIVPYEKKDLKWADKNYFANFNLNFEEGLEKKYSSPSPNIYTVGDMEKFWFAEDNQTYLAKCNSYMYNKISINDVQSEYLAYQVASLLFGKENFRTLEYKVMKYEKKWYSVSKNFVNENISFIPISWLINYNETSKSNILKTVKNIYGQEELEDLMVFDAIILNIDRHLGNIGILVENENLKKISNAPIFDNGRSLVFDYPLYKSTEAMVYLNNYLNIKPKFYDSFWEQFLDNVSFRHVEWLNRLKNFKFENDSQSKIDSKYINKMQEIFNNQLKVFESALKEKNLL
ncbi:hypothetical protein OF364_02785 [Mycoplasma enhydrae]|uniref:hypothetical protein n=1 Tax=Mycoplasma enhydrae TaxID=2499220 RepID=UPI0021E87279|nr:hypothetical protein [Mycoplasma enhydrae]MCV3753728.1 hypothetical protein [Mycoplasma enhydrae]